MKLVILCLVVCVFVSVECRSVNEEENLLNELTSLLAEKRETGTDEKPGEDLQTRQIASSDESEEKPGEDLQTREPQQARYYPALKAEGEKHVESRSFSWLDVHEEHSSLDRATRRLIFRGATKYREPAGEKVNGGYQYNTRQYYRVCRAYYENGYHLGKYFKSRYGYICHLGWGKLERRLSKFQALINTCKDKTSAVWVPYPYKYLRSLPTGAIRAGWEKGGYGTRYLYICRAWYRYAYHPGKILVGGGSYAPYRCNFGWGGREKVASKFQILVDTCDNKNNGRK